MPANLPPQYFDTEKKLKTAKTPQEKIAILEELLAIVPKHKGTEKLQALLKSKIAKLKSQAQKKPVVAKRGPAFMVEKAGAGQIILIGAPNVGKSTLLAALTNARPEIADYPFTTRFPQPGMMPYENIQIQLVDIPPITEDYFEFWQAELIKNADGVIVVMEATSPDLGSDYLDLLAKLEERKIELVGEELEIPPEKFLFQKKALLVINKIDLSPSQDCLASLKEALFLDFDPLLLSAVTGKGLTELKEKLFRFLEIIRVYSKIPGKKPDFEDPFIFKKGSTVMDLARSIHKDFAEKLRYARLWKKEGLHLQGVRINREYILEDEDIVELHM
ncbi:MAG: hypothetical protein B5M54_03660 [Candidatus Aminicenantes bacterium 4484_214]|nr:MAG: hypothetical protein B5M54_03660 [Candidatus Aminicenantes bacterium 4484_214]